MVKVHLSSLLMSPVPINEWSGDDNDKTDDEDNEETLLWTAVDTEKDGTRELSSC